MKKVPVFVFCALFSWSAYSQNCIGIETEKFNPYFPTVEKGDTTMWFQDPCEPLRIRLVLWCDTSIELYVVEKDSIGRVVRQDCASLYRAEDAPGHQYLVFEAKGVDYTYTMDGLPVGYSAELTQDRIDVVFRKVSEYFVSK